MHINSRKIPKTHKHSLLYVRRVNLKSFKESQAELLLLFNVSYFIFNCKIYDDTIKNK